MVKRVIMVVLVILFVFYFATNLQTRGGDKAAQNDHPTFFEIQKAAVQYFEGIKETSGRKPGFKQFKRWEWFARDRLDKDGYLDPALSWKGWLEKEERFGPAGDANGSWTPLGPDIGFR